MKYTNTILVLLFLSLSAQSSFAGRRALLGGLFKSRKATDSQEYYERQEQLEKNRAMGRFMKKPQLCTLEEEKEFGQTLVAKFLHRRKVKLVSFENHRDVWDYCNVLCSSLLRKLPSRRGLPWCVAILASEDPLIFSAPGGYILLSTGLLRQLENEAELAGLLAFEMALIWRRHHLYLIYSSMHKARSKKMFFSVLSNAAANKKQGADSLAALNRSANQSMESTEELICDGNFGYGKVYEADEIALGLIAYTGYSPKAYAKMVKRLQGEDRKFRKSLPKAANRVSKMKEYVSKNLPWYKDLAIGRERFLNSMLEKLD